MKVRLLTFFHREEGAVTVEWVVLTAAIIGLTVTAYSIISDGSGNLSGNTDTALSTMVVGTGTVGE